MSSTKNLDANMAISRLVYFSTRCNSKFQYELAPPLEYNPFCSVITLSSTSVTSGNISRNSFTYNQCVEHFFPSISPVEASINAPKQRLATSDPPLYC